MSVLTIQITEYCLIVHYNNDIALTHVGAWLAID